jgi:hypothetical protein
MSAQVVLAHVFGPGCMRAQNAIVGQRAEARRPWTIHGVVSLARKIARRSPWAHERRSEQYR